MRISITKEWVKNVSFIDFCKDANVKKLTYKEQKLLYEHETGKKVKSKKGEGE